MEKEIGWYDDMCYACGREQTVSIRSEKQTKWFCSPCEFENDVREEE